MTIGLTRSKMAEFGKASNSVMRAVIPPMVNRDDLADAIGYVENAGAPSAVVPDFVSQRLFDTSNNVFYIAFGLSAGNWTPLGDDTLTLAELAYLDGALSSNAVASKAAIIDSTGILALGNNKLATEAGAGITGGTGTVYKSSVSEFGGIIKTSIIIDLTGLGSSTTDLDIIGQGASPAHLGQITAARNGTILWGTMTCLEVPATGADDIDLYAATESTGVFDAGIATLVETALVTAGGAWTAGLQKIFSADVAADKYLYLTGGEAGTVGTYTAGKFLLELYGYDA
ncbi:MAG: hypothetical protein RLZZ200_2232 [Pseudomonadota bacterium]|jgi:hypothetical protein